jgi:hypothetical protein
MLQPNPPISGFAIHVTTCYVGGPDEITLITVVHDNEPVAYAEVHAVASDGTSQLIGRSPNTIGKVDSASADAFPDGTVRLWVSAALPKQPGATSFIQYIDFPKALPMMERDVSN